MKKTLAVMVACVCLTATGCASRTDNTDTADTNKTTTTESISSAPDKNNGENISTQKLFDKAKAALGEIPATVSVDNELFEEYYGKGDILEYICEIPAMNVHATEITVVKFKENISENDAEKFFEKRQKSLEQTWETYLPDQYEIVKDSVVAVRGQYALYCVGENADKAEDAFENEPFDD